MYVAKVKRPYTKKEDGNITENPGWTDIGIANNGGSGITLYPNFQPLVIDGKVEPIFLFPMKKKEADNDQPI
tara:strand:+ start:4560 stop:4775 length:216 start_codon:yes stop_codon:yes gene_type:complete